MRSLVLLLTSLLIELSLCHAINDTDYYLQQGEAALAEQRGEDELTEEELLEILGNITFPSRETAAETCGIAVNANREVCNALIAPVTGVTPFCECYDFCGGQLERCYPRGGVTNGFGCPEGKEVVVGCFVNYTKPAFLDTEPDPCPIGHICSRDDQTNCDALRNITIALQLGDIHAGIYCPGTKDRNVGTGYQNCPVGFYCPNSTTTIPCPEGYYCPHKTAQPEILCATCKEGVTDLLREQYGYIVIFVAFGLLVLLMIFVLFKQRNQNLIDRLSDLQELSLFSVRSAINFRNRKKQLQELKPKLKVIENRLNKLQGDSRISGNIISTETASGNVKFDAQQLFDILDSDGNGELSYQELNEVLQLKPAALREFAARMNKAGKEPSGTTTISRAVFVKYFLLSLEASSYFEPTPEEAAQLFDAIASQCETVDGEVPFAQFYHSVLSEFLTDKEIHDMLARFKSLQAIEDQESQRGDGKHEASSYRTVPNGSTRRRPSHSTKRKSFFGNQKINTVSREEFMARYPSLLLEVTDKKEAEEEQGPKEGIDLAFENLSLTVNVKSNPFRVVNDCTGRLPSGTMTALMGGSGAGKTSLLNALCGRAFYGEVTGTIKINGQNSTIEDHASSVGFVPQDDIVFAELTVRENLIFSGKFQLPNGTPLDEIEDLADKTMAALGLSRVMNSMVGDVRRRGVSGGEKKRVNIGLELMSRPKILFLDEPTSGLDASSAMLVMSSLKTLVEVEGVTICSVIHQPRKFIFDLFDGLILLGVGGYIVYHGKVGKAEKYFKKLNYQLPPGESVADWLIDISSGRMVPHIADKDDAEQENGEEQPTKKEKKRKDKQGRGTSRSSSFSDSDDDHDPPARRSTKDSDEDPEMLLSAAEKEKARREHLYSCWRKHFERLPQKQRHLYDAPGPSDFPPAVKRPGFWKQMRYQIHRQIILAIRNWYIKLIDTVLIIGGVILTSVMAGVLEPTIHDDLSGLDYYALAEPEGKAKDALEQLIKQFPVLFRFALLANQKIVGYANQCGVVVAVLVGLTATKIITEKRNEFFREAGSGYNINAHFCAINLIATLEHGVQVMLSSMFALWLRNSIASWYMYYVNFLVLSWLCVSWALVFPLLVGPSNVVLVTGFYMCFFALLFSGGVPPVRYPQLYNSPFTQLFCGLLSPTRFFVEAMAVTEGRCLPAQTGFTNLGEALVEVEEIGRVASFKIVGQGMNDFGTVITRDCNGKETTPGYIGKTTNVAANPLSLSHRTGWSVGSECRYTVLDSIVPSQSDDTTQYAMILLLARKAVAPSTTS
ncbi:Putative white-brown complex homolog protein 30 [Seminavis robusta]|uniref:White-brown complex homolog protein 30 n=1 Tax=Seminavis robusta TaxID=568900 RepID=A0A9N8DWF6_9STRA|nr:Putative white-brown complex homolog protein 30 [Seminavis robusta]|eukprot:Sro427_g140710.1 Putative white-brown complex homolog protein 30 (1293) ;mRNA; f:48582-53749